ncbi:MAG TPA: hypothetical protein VFU15_00090 [Bacteroidia bacterium]|nr:hypothetical protein [Bacteroidia bacterium]
MKKALFSVAFISSALCGQNFVPNPGFETYKELPCEPMQFNMSDYVPDWQSAAGGTPDVKYDYPGINKDCYANCFSTNPESYGSEKPHSGHGMGMIMTDALGGSYREYLAATLTQPLVKGVTYYVEMYVSLGDNCTQQTNNVGIAFFTGTFSRASGNIIITTPAVNESKVLSKAEGWTKISGTFTADDNYTYFAIGNFLTRPQTKIEKRTAKDSTHNYHTDITAYYIDDIVVRPNECSLSIGGDTLVLVGTNARLIASGGTDYTWIENGKPRDTLSHTSVLDVKMDKARVFVVSDESCRRTVTVGVLKPGDFAKKDLNGRKVKKGREVNVQNDVISVIIYDKDEVDGDSISLWYGDSCLVQHYALTKKKKEFKVKIDKDHPKQLILYAENEGSKPPNTAAFIIKDGRKSSNLILSSDLKSCDAVMLVHKDAPK